MSRLRSGWYGNQEGCSQVGSLAKGRSYVEVRREAPERKPQLALKSAVESTTEARGHHSIREGSIQSLNLSVMMLLSAVMTNPRLKPPKHESARP